MYADAAGGDIGTESTSPDPDNKPRFGFNEWRHCTTSKPGSGVWGVPITLAMLPLFVRLVQSVKRWVDSRLLTHLINVRYCCWWLCCAGADSQVMLGREVWCGDDLLRSLLQLAPSWYVQSFTLHFRMPERVDFIKVAIKVVSRLRCGCCLDPSTLFTRPHGYVFGFGRAHDGLLMLSVAGFPHGLVRAEASRKVPVTASGAVVHQSHMGTWNSYPSHSFLMSE